jgi:hypothetical protein
MDDSGRFGDAISEGVDVGHHVVAKSSFVLCGGFEIDVVEGSSHSIDLSGFDREPQFPLRFRQCQPDPAPVPEFMASGEDGPHLNRRVPGLQGGPISRMDVRNIMNVSGLRLVHSFTRGSGTIVGRSRMECYRPDQYSTFR